MTLKIGKINYLNVYPQFTLLRESGITGDFIEGVPSRLNTMLGDGSIDLSPSSSFAYAQNYRDYLLIPGASIGSRGAVRSVLLFTGEPLEATLPEEIVLTGESASSVNLLKVIFAERFGKIPPMVFEGKPVEERISQGGAGLLIGDRALKFAKTGNATCCYDLGTLWMELTGLPFVFALWMVRREACAREPEAVQRFARILTEITSRMECEYSRIALGCETAPYLTAEEKVCYWQSLALGLDDEMISGFRLYCKLALKHGLLREAPDMEFLAL